MYPQLEGGFGTMRAILPKNRKLKEMRQSLAFLQHSIRLHELIILVWSDVKNRIKNSQVMPIERWGKSGILAYSWLKIGYCGHFL